jgi:hypothetical protein
MMDFLRVFLGVELIIAVVSFLGGGPWGMEDVVKVFIGLNVAVGVVWLAIWLIAGAVG